MRNLSRKVRLPLIQVSSTKSQTDSRGSGLKLVIGHICQGSKLTLVSVYASKKISGPTCKTDVFLSYQDKNDNVIVNI